MYSMTCLKPEHLQSSHQGHDRTSIIQISDILLPFPDFKVVFIEYKPVSSEVRTRKELMLTSKGTVVMIIVFT